MSLDNINILDEDNPENINTCSEKLGESRDNLISYLENYIAVPNESIQEQTRQYLKEAVNIAQKHGQTYTIPTILYLDRTKFTHLKPMFNPPEFRSAINLLSRSSNEYIGLYHLVVVGINAFPDTELDTAMSTEALKHEILGHSLSFRKYQLIENAGRYSIEMHTLGTKKITYDGNIKLRVDGNVLNEMYASNIATASGRELRIYQDFVMNNVRQKIPSNKRLCCFIEGTNGLSKYVQVYDNEAYVELFENLQIAIPDFNILLEKAVVSGDRAELYQRLYFELGERLFAELIVLDSDESVADFNMRYFS